MSKPTEKQPSIRIDLEEGGNVLRSESSKIMTIRQVVELHEGGQLDAAEQEYHKILKEIPDQSDAMHLIGVIALQRKNYSEAERWIQKALRLFPEQGVFLNSLGRVYRETKRYEDAERCILKARSQRPEDFSVHYNLGMLYQEAEQYEKAVASFQRVLELDVDHQDARLKLIVVFSELLRYRDALEIANIAKEKCPDDAVPWGMYGFLSLKLEQYEEAVVGFDRALELDSRVAVNWSNLGVTHQAMCHFEEAQTCYEKAIQLDSTLSEAFNNLGVVSLVFGKLDAAKDYFEQSANLSEDYAEPRYCLGEIELSYGNYPEGWEGYELRLIKPKHDHRNFGHAHWEGQQLGSERLLIHTEQGIGDMVMFASCLPDLLKRASNCLVECDIRMVPVLERSFPQIDCVIRPPEVTVGVQIEYPDVDYQVGIGSLPRLYRQSQEDFSREPYLIAEPNLRVKWKDRLAGLGEGMKIGISWRGGNSKQVSFKRCSGFEEWESLLSVPNAHFVNLQYGHCETEIEIAKEQMGVTLHTWDDHDPMFNLENLFALMCELDLVISIDNATVHFAGALGVPCWVMLHKLPEWRWGLELDTCDWYSTLKLFRQKEALNWEPVFQRMQQELQETTEGFLDKGTSAVFPSRAVLETSNEEQTVEPNSISIKPRCGAVVAVLGEQAKATQQTQLESLQRAWNPETTGFSNLFPITMKDPAEGSLACQAFNFGIRRAEEQGCEWVLLLKNGDLVAPDAFAAVAPYLDDYDAIWGEIFYLRPESEYADRLELQLGSTDDVAEVLRSSPDRAFHQGHFVRTSIAKQFPFNERNPIGAEVGHFLHLWTRHRCVKIDQPLVAGLHPEIQLSSEQIVARREMSHLLWQRCREELRAA